MAKRTATASRKGTLREGWGTVKLGSGECGGKYSFASRLEYGTCTNPDELIGAAHAGYLSMALSAALTKVCLTRHGLRPDQGAASNKSNQSCRKGRKPFARQAGKPCPESFPEPNLHLARKTISHDGQHVPRYAHQNGRLDFLQLAVTFFGIK